MLQTKVKIKDKKIVRVGKSYYFPIPKILVNSEILSPDVKYDCKLNKVKS